MGPDGSFTLEIHDAVLAHRQAAAVSQQLAQASAGPVSAPVVASASPVPATVPATVIAPATGAPNPDKPAEFAFVEPKFSVKEGKADDKAAVPAVKAGEAASRFADKTAAELVVTSANAAMGQGKLRATGRAFSRL